MLYLFGWFLLFIVNAKVKCKSPKGWKCDFAAEFSQIDGDHAYCDFDVISMETPLHEFLEKYYMKKPVAINTKLSDWTNTTFWEKNNLLNDYGDYEFDVGKSINLVLYAGVAKNKMKLAQYVHDNDANLNNYTLLEPLYIFDRTIWNQEDHNFLSNHIDGGNIKFYDYAASKINYNAQILAMGPTGTGATWHAHGENWLFMLMGQKRVFLYPPNLHPVGGFWPGYSSKDWFNKIYPHLHSKYEYNYFNSNPDYNFLFESQFMDKFNKQQPSIFSRNISDIFAFAYTNFKPLECIANAGQIVYIPEFWWHAVLNVGDAAGIAVQTSTAKAPWMLERDIHDGVRHKLRSGNHWTDLEEEVNRFESVKVYKRLKEYGPLSAVHEFFIGFEYYEIAIANKFYLKKAITHFTNAILMDSTYIEAYKYLSRIYSSDDAKNKYYDINKAEDLLRIAYLLSPNNEEVRSELMRVFIKQNDRNSWEIVRQKQPLPFKSLR